MINFNGTLHAWIFHAEKKYNEYKHSESTRFQVFSLYTNTLSFFPPFVSPFAYIILVQVHSHTNDNI